MTVGEKKSAEEGRGKSDDEYPPRADFTISEARLEAFLAEANIGGER